MLKNIFILLLLRVDNKYMPKTFKDWKQILRSRGLVLECLVVEQNIWMFKPNCQKIPLSLKQQTKNE